MALDADWATEQKVDDSNALCLDSPLFGNVARFLNHKYKAESVLCFFFSPFTSFLGLTLVPGHYRCGDPNLVDVPVSIESVDRHCYHVAFFTNRIIEVGEELMWDYGTSLKHNGPSQSVFVVGVIASCAKTSCCQLQFKHQPETHLSHVGGDDLELRL